MSEQNPLGGFPDSWARRKWLMAQGVETPGKMILMVLEAYADIDTGAVIGPHGRGFSYAALTALTGVRRAALSKWIARLEAMGYLSVDRHRGRGLASRFTLLMPSDIHQTDLLANPDIHQIDGGGPFSGRGVVHLVDGVVHLVDMSSPRIPPGISPPLPPERESKKIISETEYQAMLERGPKNLSRAEQLAFSIKNSEKVKEAIDERKADQARGSG